MTSPLLDAIPRTLEQRHEQLRRDHEALHRVLDDFRREMDDPRSTTETRVAAATRLRAAIGDAR